MHLVRSHEETISQIAKWYTGTEKSNKELLALNSKVTANGLQVGESVIVPFGSLRTVVTMPRKLNSRKKAASKRHPSKKQTQHRDLEEGEDDIESQLQLPAPLSSTSPDLTESGVPHEVGPDIVALPTGAEQDPSGADNSPFGSGGRSLEELVRQEQAELEQLRRELDASE